MLHHLRDALTGALAHQLEPRIRSIAMTTAQETVNQITAQLKTGLGEILGKIADLEQAVADGQVPDFTELKSVAQALDDIVPGTPTTPPAGDPVPPADIADAIVGEADAEDGTPVTDVAGSDTAEDAPTLTVPERTATE